MSSLAEYGHILICSIFIFCLIVNASSIFVKTKQKQKVVGLGATSCAGFVNDAIRKPSIQRDYLAWAQGYMSAILLTRSGTVDNGLDLALPTFPLLKQLEFLRDFCTKRPDESFPNAVDHLYKRLRRKLAS